MSALSIILRQSPDWKNETYDSIALQSRPLCQMIGEADDAVVRAIALWDHTFPLSFFACREALKSITLENLRATKHAVVHLSPIVSEHDGFTVFIDDDDWLSPDLASVLCASPDADGWRWGSVNFDGAYHYRSVDDGTCYTNNYAISNEWLRERGRGASRLKTVDQHIQAHYTFRLGALRVVVIDRFLSVTHKHPCSTLALLRALREEYSATSLRRLVKQYTARAYSSGPADTIDWSEQYVVRASAVFQHLL